MSGNDILIIFLLNSVMVGRLMETFHFNSWSSFTLKISRFENG